MQYAACATDGLSAPLPSSAPDAAPSSASSPPAPSRSFEPPIYSSESHTEVQPVTDDESSSSDRDGVSPHLAVVGRYAVGQSSSESGDDECEPQIGPSRARRAARAQLSHSYDAGSVLGSGDSSSDGLGVGSASLRGRPALRPLVRRRAGSACDSSVRFEPRAPGSRALGSSTRAEESGDDEDDSSSHSGSSGYAPSSSASSSSSEAGLSDDAGDDDEDGLAASLPRDDLPRSGSRAPARRASPRRAPARACRAPATPPSSGSVPPVPAGEAGDDAVLFSAEEDDRLAPSPSPSPAGAGRARRRSSASSSPASEPGDEIVLSAAEEDDLLSPSPAPARAGRARRADQGFLSTESSSTPHPGGPSARAGASPARRVAGARRSAPRRPAAASPRLAMPDLPAGAELRHLSRSERRRVGKAIDRYVRAVAKAHGHAAVGASSDLGRAEVLAAFRSQHAGLSESSPTDGLRREGLVDGASASPLVPPPLLCSAGLTLSLFLTSQASRSTTFASSFAIWTSSRRQPSAPTRARARSSTSRARRSTSRTSSRRRTRRTLGPRRTSSRSRRTTTRRARATTSSRSRTRARRSSTRGRDTRPRAWGATRRRPSVRRTVGMEGRRSTGASARASTRRTRRCVYLSLLLAALAGGPGS